MMLCCVRLCRFGFIYSVGFLSTSILFGFNLYCYKSFCRFSHDTYFPILLSFHSYLERCRSEKRQNRTELCNQVIRIYIFYLTIFIIHSNKSCDWISSTCNSHMNARFWLCLFSSLILMASLLILCMRMSFFGMLLFRSLFKIAYTLKITCTFTYASSSFRFFSSVFSPILVSSAQLNRLSLWIYSHNNGFTIQQS